MEERLEDDAAVAPPGADDAELELARGDALDDRLRVEDVERDVQLGVARLELAEQVREHDPAGPGRGADVERARELVAALERDVGEHLLLEREQPLRADGRAASRPRSARRGGPERSSSCVPSRFSSARTWRLTAGCVTPSRSAAWENVRRSTTAQNAASWRVSMSKAYSWAATSAVRQAAALGRRRCGR